MINADVFDLESTLINLPINYDKLFQEFTKVAKNKNVQPLTKTIPKLDEDTRKKIFELLEKTELEAFTNLTVNTEVMPLYERFRKEPKALATMQGKLLVQKFLNRFSLSFDYAVTREQSLDRIEQLEITAEKLKVSIKDMLFIGNTDEDLSAAKNWHANF